MDAVNDMIQVAATSLGWVGAVGTVSAYALVSKGRLDPGSMRFQAANVLGAGLLALSAITAGNGPSAMSNLVWMSIGVHALVKARHALRAAITRRLHSFRPAPDSDADDVLLAA